MIASPIHELETDIHEFGNEKVLPVAVIYGANSSGKSNVIKAIANMRDVLLTSVKLNPSDILESEPFLLDLGSQSHPTSYEIEFSINNNRYRYGFEFNKTCIENEWLYGCENGKQEREYFTRAGNQFSIPNKQRFKEGLGKESATPANRLFLSLVAQLNGPISTKIINWFQSIKLLSGLDTSTEGGSTLQMFTMKSEECQDAMRFFNRLNLGFQDLSVKRISFSEAINQDIRPASKNIQALIDFKDAIIDIFKDQSMLQGYTTHNVYNEDGTINHVESFRHDRMESDGTKKVIEMAGPLFNVLAKGGILIVDELDAKLHPIMTRNLVLLFTKKESNPKGAQLIFTTHDTNLLNIKYLRRDEIWFTEKNATESSDLYSLIEFRDENGTKVRNDSSIAKDYINGRYGAIPYLN